MQNFNTPVSVRSPLKSAIESIGMIVEMPFKVLSDTLMSGSGTSTPRMIFSRESSLSSIPIEEKLEAIKRAEEEVSDALFLNLLPSFLAGSSSKKNGRDTKIPSDIIWMVLAYVAKNCVKSGNNSDLIRCTLVDKR